MFSTSGCAHVVWLRLCSCCLPQVVLTLSTSCPSCIHVVCLRLCPCCVPHVQVVLTLSTLCPGCVNIVYLVSRLSLNGWVLWIYSLILFGHEFSFISVPKLFGSRHKWQSNQVSLKNGLKATTMGPREQFVLRSNTGSCRPVRSSPLHIIYYPSVLVLVVFNRVVDELKHLFII